LPKYGLTEVIFGICNSIVLHIQLDIIYLAFCCYLHNQFFNHHRFRADGILIPVLRQALSVGGYANQPVVVGLGRDGQRNTDGLTGGNPGVT
jgi:hypothetical protein